MKPFGFALALAIVGMALGYAGAMPFLPASGWVPAGLVGAGLGLAMARALWITRPEAMGAPQPEHDEASPTEPGTDDPHR